MKITYLRRLCRLGVLTCLGISFLASCQKEDRAKETQSTGISILGSKDPMTKSSETKFAEGDQVGAFIVRYADTLTPGLLGPTNYAANLKFTSDNTGHFFPDNVLNWYTVAEGESPKSDFYAYYPYNAALDLNNLTEIPFSIKKNQSAYADYVASDFMWVRVLDVTPEISSVPMVFKHVMSRFVLNVKAATGTLDASKLQVKFKGVKSFLTWNLRTMVPNNRDSIADITPYQLPTAASGFAASYVVILPPQVITSGLIEFVYDNGAPKTWSPLGTSVTRFDLCYSKQYTLNVGLNL